MIRFENLKKIFSFQPEELYDFVEKQGTEFRLQLSISTDDSYLIDEIEPFIDPRFLPGEFGNANVLVAIHSSSTHHMVYTLPGSEKNWYEKAFPIV
uniref:Type II toxin-antitoxin system RelE/ParE family toxin n=1 Tax=Panagrellus redivivus TaxID=6233 RepID=A0A7E4ZQG4_PANRE